MDRDRYAHVRAQFHELFPLAPEQRDARLAELDPDVRAELRALLGRTAAELLAEERLGRVGERLVHDELAASTPDDAPLPERVGPFRVVRRLGAGGMGVVYLACQEEPVRREVALKVVRATLGDSVSLARFAIEREVLARLSHPNIARLYQAGATDDGAPYFAMEYVPGDDLVRYADRTGLGLEQRLRLFREVCAGVQHAHQKGVLHRDLKPSNLLVAEEGGRAAPKVIDFGIARLVDSDPTGTGLTGAGWIGSPAYMSPEALAGGEVDTRADVYSLGVVLYELLAGVRPRADAAARSADDTPRPSTRYRALDEDTARDIATRRGLAPAALAKRFRGDLDWIVMTAIAEEPDRRYPSAAALAADIGRHLEHRPVEARPPTAAYVARRLMRRHRVGLSAAALVLLSLVLGLVGLTQGLVRARAAEQDALAEARRADDEARAAQAAEADALAQAARAEREADFARDVESFLVGLFEVSDPLEGRGGEVTARELLDAGAAEIEAELADRPLLRARMMRTIGKVQAQLGLFAAARPLLEGALAVHEQHAETWPLELATSCLELGNLAILEGRPDAAREPLERALELREEHLPADHLNVAGCLILLANADYSTGRCDEARPRLERALDIQARHGEVASAANATTLTLVGACLAETDLEAATPCFERALAIREATLPEGHLDIARASINLGLHHLRLGRAEAARPLLHAGIEQSERALGSDHPELVTSLIALAEATPDFDEAEPLYLRGLDVCRSSGQDSMLIATLCEVVGARCTREGLPEEAEIFFEESLGRLEARLPREHPRVMQALVQLAQAIALQGRTEDALPLRERALETMRRALPPTDPNVASAMHDLGSAYAELGRFEEAEPLLREALERRTGQLGPDEPETLASALALAGVLAALGHTDEAGERYRDVVARLDRVEAPVELRAPALADQLRFASRHAEPAELLALADAALAQTDVFPPEHPDRGGLVACRALALFDLGRSEDATRELQRAAELLGGQRDTTWESVLDAARERR